MHEYILVYQASSAWNRNLLPRGEEKDRQYRFQDSLGIFRLSDYTCNKSATERPNLYYPIIQPNTGEEIWPKKTAAWRYSQERHEHNEKNGFIYWGKDGLGKVPAFKRYKHLLKNADGVVPTTWWTFEEVGHTDTAKKELLDILSEHTTTFSTPKPVRLIERILRIATKPDDLVLDFFAGSGTTAHAVMKLNAEDGGNRRFILVSNTEATDDAPGKNLCREVCAERVRRIICGYTNKKGEAVQGLGGDPSTKLRTGFAYLRTRRIPAEAVLSRIEHEQVWTALQLIHTDALQPYTTGAAMQTAELPDGRLAYCLKANEETISQLLDLAEGNGIVVVYSWQPGWLRQYLPNETISVEQIPAFLINRFGGDYAA